MRGDPIDIGIVGCGVIGRKHAAVYAAAGHRVRAVADPVEAARRVVAEAHGARPYADPVEMIEREPLQVVSICSPPTVRQAPIAAAARRGCHVFCEKPLALGLDEAEAIWATASRAGIALGFGFKMRFEGAFAAAHRLVADGAIGRPELLVLTYFQPPPATAWYLEIGTLRDTLVHAIDLAAWLLGAPVRQVHAVLHHTFNPQAEDRAELTLELPPGRALVAGGYLEGFPPVGGRDDICFQLVGPGGYLAGTRSRGLVLANREGVRTVPAPQGDGFAAEIEAFLAALARDPAAIPVTGLDGLRAQAVIEASHESARRSAPVAVREVGRPGAPATAGPR
jgi:myo-inositol 2-dehydrogenase / D-chiro-inositol 1-dehydrogenase